MSSQVFQFPCYPNIFKQFFNSFNYLGKKSVKNSAIIGENRGTRLNFSLHLHPGKWVRYTWIGRKHRIRRDRSNSSQYWRTFYRYSFVTKFIFRFSHWYVFLFLVDKGLEIVISWALGGSGYLWNIVSSEVTKPVDFLPSWHLSILAVFFCRGSTWFRSKS